MKSIEIATAHNIVVTHDLATIWQRIMAFTLDAIILSVYAGFVALVSGGNGAMLYIGIILVLLFYHLVLEVFNQGQSVGKKIVNLRVVSIRGTTPTLQDFILRWVFRMVDITFTLGSLAIVSIITSPRSQRLGDLLGRTTVISLRSRRPVSLANIEKLDSKRFDVLHHGVARYTDSDMLLVKQTLARYQQNPNDANADLILDLSDRIRGDLNVGMEGNHIDFLKKVLTDYIVLTR